ILGTGPRIYCRICRPIDPPSGLPAISPSRGEISSHLSLSPIADVAERRAASTLPIFPLWWRCPSAQRGGPDARAPPPPPPPRRPPSPASQGRIQRATPALHIVPRSSQLSLSRLGEAVAHDAIGDRLGEVDATDGFGAVEVGERARDLEHAM